MKLKWNNRYFRWGLTLFLVAAASMLFYYGIFRMGNMIGGIKAFLSIWTPIIYGAVIAYLLSSVVNFIEGKVIYPLCRRNRYQPSKRIKKVIRYFCVLLSLFLFLLLIYALIMMILPELIRSVINIVNDFPRYITSIQVWITETLGKNEHFDSKMLITFLNQYSEKAETYLTDNFLPQMQLMLRQVSSGVFDILNFLKNFLIGSIVSIYILADKEGFVAKSKMIAYALFETDTANTMIHGMRFVHKTFGGFINGKIVDSAIIGVLCYIGTSIIGTPYAVLISVIVGVTNVIPFFGPYIGAVPSAFLVLMVDPWQCLYFVIFILVLQQFDGNFLGPKILGESTGLSSLMVIVAILVGGDLFGVLGMFVGVPVCAVIYAIIWSAIRRSLKKKDMPPEAEVYYHIDCLNEQTKEPILFKEKEEKETPVKGENHKK